MAFQGKTPLFMKARERAVKKGKPLWRHFFTTRAIAAEDKRLFEMHEQGDLMHQLDNTDAFDQVARRGAFILKAHPLYEQAPAELKTAYDDLLASLDEHLIRREGSLSEKQVEANRKVVLSLSQIQGLSDGQKEVFGTLLARLAREGPAFVAYAAERKDLKLTPEQQDNWDSVGRLLELHMAHQPKLRLLSKTQIEENKKTLTHFMEGHEAGRKTLEQYLELLNTYRRKKLKMPVK